MGAKERPGSRGGVDGPLGVTQAEFQQEEDETLAGVRNTAEGKVVNFANFFKKDVDNGCHTGKRM